MPNYDIEYVYSEPMQGIIEEFPAEDKETAEQLAYKEIEMMYPEAEDVKIIRVTEVK